MRAPNYAEIWRGSFHGQPPPMEQYRDEETARSYDASESIWRDGYARAAGLPCRAGDRVLDIGSGPGILAVPLAEKGCLVTVVEPSAAMLKLLAGHSEARGLDIETLHGTWEDSVLSEGRRFDYVIASYSLGMRDMEAALRKMNACAKKEVFLYWFCGVTAWEKISGDLLPALGRSAPPYRPKADILYGILSQMGIAADVQWLKGTAFNRAFPDRAGALMDLRRRLGISDDSCDELFQRYLDSGGIYQETDNGWLYSDITRYVRISWRPTADLSESECAWVV